MEPESGRASLAAQMVRICLQGRRPRFSPWVGKMPWRREWQPTPVSLPREFQGLRGLASYSPWGHKESDATESLCTHHSGQHGNTDNTSIIAQNPPAKTPMKNSNRPPEPGEDEVQTHEQHKPGISSGGKCPH